MKKTVSEGIHETVLGDKPGTRRCLLKNADEKRITASNCGGMIQLTIDPAKTTEKTAKGAGDDQPGLQAAFREGGGIEAGEDWSWVDVGFFCILQVRRVFV
ncbi:MAG: hypothetical protein Q9188_006866 [Gyalolechia gomerana]